jgi:GNAT superfamily N-acetyltransferase
MAVRVPPAERIDPADVMPTLLTALADDPLWRWLYPDEETYERAFPEVMLLAARTGFDLGTVDVGEGGKAVAVWDPPGSDVDPNEVETMWIAHFQAYCDPARLDDVFAWSEQFGRYHPTEPHWYLGGLGVTPDRQGRGHGSALLRVGLERCDRDGLPAYLKASNARNRPLYERHWLRGHRRDPGRGLTTGLADAPPAHRREVADVLPSAGHPDPRPAAAIRHVDTSSLSWTISLARREGLR